MAYAPLDEHFDEHPKFEDLELEHLGLMACAISYCNRLLTDGFVSDRAVRGFGRSGRGPRAASKLIEKGIWERVQNGYQVVGFLDHNPSRVDVIARREQARVRKENQRIREVPSDVTRDSKRDDQLDSRVTSRAGAFTALHCTALQDIRSEIPPTPPVGGPTKRTRTVGQRLPEDWQVSEQLRAWAKGKGITNRDVERVAEDFRDHWRASTMPTALKADWDAAFRTWARTSVKRGEITPVVMVAPSPPPTVPSASQEAARAEQRRMFEAAAAQMTLVRETGS